MPDGTGTIEQIKKQAASINIDLPIPALPVPVDPTVDPLPSLGVGEGIQKVEELGVLEKVKLAYEVASPTAGIVQAISDEHITEYDNDFDITEHKDLFEGLDSSLYSYMFESKSYNDALYRRDEIKTEQDKMALLMRDGGVSGMVYFLGATIVDPVTIASMAVEGAGALRIASKASRLQRIMRTGGTVGALAGAETAVLASTKATVDTEDVIYSMAGGMILGSGMSAVADRIMNGNSMSAMADLTQDRVGRGIMRDADGVLLASIGPKTPVFKTTEESVFRQFDPETQAAIRSLNTEAGDLGEEIAEEGFKYDEALFESIRAERAAGRFNPELIKESKLFKIISKNPAQSDFIRLFNSKSEEVQFIAMELLENASGVAGRQKTASILQAQWKKKHLDNLMPTMHKAYKTFAKKNKSFWYQPHKYFGSTRTEFDKVIRTELESYSQASYKGGKYVSEAEEYIQEAVDAWRKEMSEMYDLAKANGVRGFEDIVAHDGYVPLIWNGKLLAGMKKSVRAKYAAMAQRGYVDLGIPEADAEIIQGAVFNRQMSNAIGLDTNPNALLSKDSREFLRELLRGNKEKVGMKETEIDKLFSRIDTNMANRGKSSRARSRVPINLNISDNELHLMDIVENNLSTLGTRYISELSGRSALARKGIRHDGAWTSIKSTLLKESIKAGDQDTIKIGKVLDALYNQFLGQPVGKGVHAVAGDLQDWATASMLGMTGIPQMAEIGNVMGAHGLANVIKHSPELRAYKRAIKAGNADETLLGQLRAGVGGLWGEDLFFRPEVRLDEVGEATGYWAVVRNALAGSKQAVGYMSGMNQVKNMEQKLVAVLQANKVLGMLNEGSQNARLLKRFADVGWDEKFLSKLKNKLDDGTITFQDNGSIDQLNMSTWSPELVENFSTGMHRHAAQLIQFPHIGETGYWQHETIGSLLTQFRSFTLLAIEKQSARQIHIADPEALATLAWSMGAAAALYYTKVQAVTLGMSKSDRKEYLDKRLSAAAVLNGAMLYSGILSATSEVVNAGSFFGVLPPNAYTGSTSRGGAPVPPAMSVAWSATKAAGGISRGLSPWGDHDAGKQEINDLFKASVWGNTYPMIVLKNTLKGAIDE